MLSSKTNVELYAASRIVYLCLKDTGDNPAFVPAAFSIAHTLGCMFRLSKTNKYEKSVNIVFPSSAFEWSLLVVLTALLEWSYAFHTIHFKMLALLSVFKFLFFYEVFCPLKYSVHMLRFRKDLLLNSVLLCANFEVSVIN